MPEFEVPDRRALFADHLLRHWGRLFAYVYALMRNVADADDVFQQTENRSRARLRSQVAASSRATPSAQLRKLRAGS